MGTRVFVGGLTYRVRERDLEKFFRKYGRIKEVAMKNGFAFVVSCYAFRFGFNILNTYYYLFRNSTITEMLMMQYMNWMVKSFLVKGRQWQVCSSVRQLMHCIVAGSLWSELEERREAVTSGGEAAGVMVRLRVCGAVTSKTYCGIHTLQYS